MIVDTRIMANGIRTALANTTVTTSAQPSSDSHVANYDPAIQASWPDDLKFGPAHMLAIIAYSTLICISMVGNVTVLIAMCRRRRKAHARINTMLMHLAIADLLVSTKHLVVDRLQNE